MGGAKAYAATSAESSQRGKLELKRSCRLINYQYSVNFIIRLPKLTDETPLPPSARARWQQFSAFLRNHGETHRSIWMGCANEIQTRVSAVRGRSCEEVERKAEAMREDVQKACNRKHIAFDAAEKKKLAKHPFVNMVLAPIYKPLKLDAAPLAAKKRKKAAEPVRPQAARRSQSAPCQTCESIGRSSTRSATNRRRNPVSGSSR
ncbi:DUF922 domain-containing Zn-dependent protease [Nordella sp. HKS 07]|uniref:DUF922 domain-containing protein n=1 Tax=Nordella sp. HKS 07 TaxID=2712222 RepID=UPI0013E17306|nr:DUF922 domain-containing Zn-dependent protease [Nordella sp. HKS 07]